MGSGAGARLTARLHPVRGRRRRFNRVTQETSSAAAAGTTPAVSSDAPASAAPATAKPGRKYDRSIIEGPLTPAVWKIAWPTMLTNVIGGLQGIIDHVMVGNFVGFRGNAAIGVSWQIFLVVIVFISSIFIGMSVLVARFTGANDHEKVDRVVYQAFLTAIGLSLLIMAPLGYSVSPFLLDLVNAAPEVKAEALPFLRIMFVASSGMMVFFMLGGALRAAGDARTGLKMGAALTAMNIGFNLMLIPALGTKGAAIGTCTASGLLALFALYRLINGGWVISFPKGNSYAPDWSIIKSLFKFGLPAGIQGIAMNIGGVVMLGFIGSLAQSAAAQAAFSVSYGQLFSLITWTSTGLMGAAAAVAGQNLGANNPDRADKAVHTAARIAVASAATVGLAFFFIPRTLLLVFGMHDETVLSLGVQLLRVLSVSGLFIAVALTYTGGLQGTGDTKSPLYISVISQIIVPLSIVFVIKQTGTLDPIDIWIAILIGHITRCALSAWRFRQGKWRHIKVELAH
jgi:putative MATE family efflux protein